MNLGRLQPRLCIEIMAALTLILVLASIAIPRVHGDRIRTKELAAIRTIRAIQTAQAQYSSRFGWYATTLRELGPPTSGFAGQLAADLIPEDLAAGRKGGYRFSLHGGPQGYTIAAVPAADQSTGRTFYSDQTLVIRQNWGPEPANAQSKAI